MVGRKHRQLEFELVIPSGVDDSSILNINDDTRELSHRMHLLNDQRVLLDDPHLEGGETENPIS